MTPLEISSLHTYAIDDDNIGDNFYSVWLMRRTIWLAKQLTWSD